MEVFKTLKQINVNDKTEKKGGMTYLSWAFAWDELKRAYSDATYDIKFFNNLPYCYDENTGYMVFTTVTIESLTHSMWLPVMNGANKAMKKDTYTYKKNKWENGKKILIDAEVEAATMFDINKTIMRCLVKNMAMFGLGLYIYAGEDLPEVEPVELEYVSKDQIMELEAEIVERDINRSKFIVACKVEKLELLQSQYFKMALDLAKTKPVKDGK